MAKSKPDTSKKRDNESARARRIRQALEVGREVSPDDLAFLETYLETKSRRGRPIKVAADVITEKPPEPDGDQEPAEPQEPPPQETVSEDAKPAPDPAPAPTPTPSPAPPQAPPPTPRPSPKIPKPPRIEAPKPPPPPRVDRETPRAGSGDWRDKYKGEIEGREATVLECANAICGVLGAMASEIEMVGAKPVIDPKDLFNPWVLTLDKWLPSHLVLQPEHKALFGASGIVVQRFMKRKEINEAIKLQKAATDEKARVEQRKAEVAAKQEQNPKPPHPDPVKPGETGSNGVATKKPVIEYVDKAGDDSDTVY